MCLTRSTRTGRHHRPSKSRMWTRISHHRTSAPAPRCQRRPVPRLGTYRSPTTRPSRIRRRQTPHQKRRCGGPSRSPVPSVWAWELESRFWSHTIGASPPNPTAQRTPAPSAEVPTSAVPSAPSALKPSDVVPPPAFPSIPPPGTVLAPNANGYVFIETKSGKTRCVISSDEVDCEARFTNSPVIDGEHAQLPPLGVLACLQLVKRVGGHGCQEWQLKNPAPPGGVGSTGRWAKPNHLEVLGRTRIPACDS